MSGRGLAVRDVSSTELMDDPDCELDRLERTYTQFTVVNRLVSGWRTIYRRRIRPVLSAHTETTLLDIGFGGGDVPRALARWAAADGLRLSITAIDPDDRARRFVEAGQTTAGVSFRQAGSADLVADGSRFDIVTSNHLLHHLDDLALSAVLSDSRALARGFVLHNDIERSRIAYVTYFPMTAPFSRGSFIHQDGLLSIRRSYRRAELERAVPEGWRVERLFPYRLLLVSDGVSATLGERETADTNRGEADE